MHVYICLVLTIIADRYTRFLLFSSGDEIITQCFLKKRYIEKDTGEVEGVSGTGWNSSINTIDYQTFDTATPDWHHRLS